MKSTKLIAKQIFESSIQKQSDLINDIARVISLRLDEKIVNKGMKVLKILDKIETSPTSSMIDKHDLTQIKEKINQSMQKFQEALEDLFSLHERLVRENEMETN